MRVPSGRALANGGWLHREASRQPIPLPPPPKPMPSIDAAAMHQAWLARTSQASLEALARQLGVSAFSLAVLSAAWAAPHAAWAFPMRDVHGLICGIRLRAEDGRKWAVRGSHQGVFLPDVPEQRTAYVAEGPTDTAAGLTLGLYCVGRPSCNTGGLQLRTLLRRRGVTRVVMLTDNDEPGRRGSERVAGDIGLPWCHAPSDAKDLRAFLRCGGTRAELETVINNQVFRTV